MRIARFALVTLKGTAVRDLLHAQEGQLLLETDGIVVSLDPEPNTTDRLIVLASMESERNALVDVNGDGLVPLRQIRALEAVIAEVVDLLTIASGQAPAVSSFEPEFGFFDLTGDDRAFINGLGELRLDSNWQVVRPRDGGESPNLRDLVSIDLSDRSDGVRLLAEALSSDHPTGKFRELCRLFERAFGLGPHALVGPLSEFLSEYEVLAVSVDEVSAWLDNLRHLATHADRREQFAVASDVIPVLPRILFAARDVLFNKAVWRDASTTRRQGWRPAIAPLANGMAVVQGAVLSLQWQVLDRFGVYPLRLGGERTTIRLPHDWIAGDAGTRPPGDGILNVVPDSLLGRAPDS
ncbi:hypothetical protein SAMN04487846_3455 [Microbacterium sp. cf046]|nr:hypothetical protein SAMN04487846_3455 [Microbacterium sp. cf046]